ncbi:MAG: chromosome segregation protein SMC [Acutalibacteraceae bacterium]|jgi:chromosome segregation protein|nr:chromosome segregation protein SMC [Clostridiales bacterium]
MILKALELQGFKSFPDKTILTFGPGMTSVVGPNGSGKSNISDAVRWVLGEQSTKSLRGSKMEDVIFGGTSQRKAQGYAQVTLRMDNTDRLLPKDEDEIAVTRRYYRSGESEYKINGETARLRDIHEMFMDTGLGRDGYSIVSQGKIADMVSAKSKERRDMFEEAAGISQFRYRRSDALRRLSQTQENLIRLKDILSELESRVGPLKIQSEKASQFLVLSARKKEIEIGLWLYTIEKLKNTLREQEDKITLATSQYTDCEKSLADVSQNIELIIEKTQGITVEIDEIRRNISDFEERVAHFDANIAVSKNTIELNNQAIERVKKDMEQTNQTQSRIDFQIKEAQTSVDECLKVLEQKQNELAQIYDKTEKLSKENEEFAGKIQGLSQDLSKFSLALADSRVSLSTAQSTKGEIIARNCVIDEQLSGTQQLAKQLEQEKSSAQTALDDAEQKIEEWTNAITGYTMREQKRAQKVQELKEELDNLSIEIKQKQSKIHMLQELEKNMEGYLGSVKAVIRESKRGSIRGVHGALSQLIVVKDKYAVAVETALGAAVQNIVVESEADAKRAINYLKQNKLGRATFLPISAIKGRELSEKDLDDCYGFVGIASELVKVDSKYDNIIKAQLGRTVVVEDIDCAIVIAKKYSNRFKIVTLDGQVMNAGGSMTGGSRSHNSGILSRANQIEKIGEEVQKRSKDLEQSNQSYKLAVEELSKARADLTGAKADLATTQEEKVKAQGLLSVANSKIQSAKQSYEELLSEKQTAESRILALENQINNENEKIKNLTDNIEKVEKQISHITGDRENLSKKRDELVTLASDINLEILATQKDIDASRENIKELEKRRVIHDGRNHELLTEIEQMVEKNNQQQSMIEEYKNQAQTLRQTGESSAKEIEKLVQERKELEGQSVKQRQFERQKLDEREKISGELARLQERKSSMQKEYDDIINKLYDEYQLTHRQAGEVSMPCTEPSKSQKELAEIKSKIRALGSVNVGAIEEYKEVSERYEFMSTEINDIEKSRDELIKLIDELTMNMSARFREQFVKINQAFGETFVHLFGGGKAQLVLEDERDILECGIDIEVQPPGKNVQNIDLLSGGEKGLSAIALLFAMLKVTPAPFCIFDEVEAALDDVNVLRYAQYVRKMTDKTQFILITHRRGTMEESDRLYGVTMQEKGVSKILELKTAEMAQKLGIA